MATPSPHNSPRPPPDTESDPTTPTGASRNEEIADEDENAELPLTMAASVVLTTLPTDAKSALEGAGDLGVEKGMSHSNVANSSMRTILFLHFFLFYLAYSPV